MKQATKSSGKRQPPARTAEARQNRLIALAFDGVEERLRNGTASAQEYIHFLKLASQKEELELEKLRRENELLEAKREVLESSKRMEEAYTKAIDAMRSYTGKEDDEKYPKEVVLGID